MIDVTINTTDNGEPTFPKLMIHKDDSIFYFVRSGYGLPLIGNWAWGDQALAEWEDMSDFTDFNGSITIKNK